MENQSTQSLVSQPADQSVQPMVPKNKFWKGFFVGVLATVGVSILTAVIIFLILTFTIRQSIDVTRESLDLARERAGVAAVKSHMSMMRAKAEISYDENESYANVCSDRDIVESIAFVRDITVVKDITCLANKDSFIVGALMVAEGSMSTYCVDAKGHATSINRPLTEVVTGPSASCI